MSKIKSWCIICLNSLLIIAVAICLYFMAIRPLSSLDVSTSNEPFGFKMFYYVNSDAALFLAFASITMIISAAQFLIQKRPNLHFLKYAYVFKMIVTVWEMFVFFMVVIVIGAWLAFPSYIYIQEQSVLNIVLPIASMLIFVFLEYKRTNWMVVFYSAIPVLAYILIMVIVVYTNAYYNSIGTQAPYEIFFFKDIPTGKSIGVCFGLIVGTLATGFGIYFANWAMFEKAYPRLATIRYQKELLKVKANN